MPKNDVEAILAKMYKLKGKSFLHTNATLIDDEWIRIFKKYKTKVGVSWDGPKELSAYRPGTNKVGAVIERLAKEGLIGSVLIVVSKANAGTSKRLEKLKKYLLRLHQFGISGRLLACTNAPIYELNMGKLKKVYLDLAKFCLENNLRWSPFTDIINGLKGKDRVCIFMPGDPFATPSVITVLEDGSLTGCMRTDQFKGILLRHPAQYRTRNEILENVSQEYGGCKGCKYWTSCFGGCSFDVINNDWRNRTYLCPLWKTLFEFYEKILTYFDIPVLPQKSSPQKNPVQELTDGGHGDVPHGDSGHGDSSHGDNPYLHENFAPQLPALKQFSKQSDNRINANKGIIRKDFKIDFIGIGAPRCGTTWIARCLAEHPQVCFSSEKEPDFFLDSHYRKGLKFYQSFFKDCGNGRIRGEFSPSYYLNKKVPQRIKKYFPNVKLLVCLRNPIERILSHYKFKIKTGQKINPNISKELSSNRYYMLYGLYYQYLSKFFKYFNPKNILILIYEDTLSNPTKFIKISIDFLKLMKTLFLGHSIKK